MSSQSTEDVKSLRERIIDHFEKDMVEQDITVPFDQGKLLGEIHSTMKVIKETHEDFGTILRVRAYPETIASVLKTKS
jgi:GTP-binding protein HflX